MEELLVPCTLFIILLVIFCSTYTRYCDNKYYDGILEVSEDGTVYLKILRKPRKGQKFLKIKIIEPKEPGVSDKNLSP